MDNTVVINPVYGYLKDFIDNIPELFEKEGKIIYDSRNKIKVIENKGTSLTIKSFKVPNFVNQIAYSFVRPSKAKRAYEYSLKLLEKGIHVPQPVAYIEEYQWGLLKRSYFIYEYLDNVSHIRQEMLGNSGGEDFETALAKFIARMHNKGILHLDMSPGNILWRKENGNYVFYIIDFNRMQFLDEIPKEKRYKSFKRISEEPRIISHLAQVYAHECNLDEEEAIREINKYCYQFYKK